jgi:hypothetical protein
MRLMAHQTARLKTLVGSTLVAWLAVAGSAEAGRKPKPVPPPFEYVGGTETAPPSCGGNLEVRSDSLVFICPRVEIKMPFASISLMQYRSDVSYHVSKLNVTWKAFPLKQRGKQNRFFAVVYAEATATHVVILQVAPQAMRPYLAEIELKSGKRVEVEGYEGYP